MTIRLDCPTCRAPLDVGRRHRGRAIACPACRAEVEVPRGMDFREARRGAAGDRRTGDVLLVVAAVAAIVWVATPVCAAVWWWTTRLITHAADDGRVPAEPLLVARVVAAVGFLAQATFWATRFV